MTGHGPGASATVAPPPPLGAAGPTIELTGVAVGYDERPVLEAIDLTLDAGALTAVVGPNGGGKSTLLRMIAGLLKPWSGAIRVLGAEPGVHARAIAYVPQAEAVDWGFPVAAGDVPCVPARARAPGVRRGRGCAGPCARARGPFCVRTCRRGPAQQAQSPFCQSKSGDVLLSHTVSRAVPSALKGLASGFGMEPGVSLSPWSP